MARAVARLVIAAVLVVSVLLVDPRPGWCPFDNPTPSSDITIPYIQPEATPTPETGPSPTPEATPDRGGQPTSTQKKPRRGVRETWRPHWSTLLGLALVTLVLLFLPAVWMRTVFRRFDLPPELEPQTGAWARAKRKQSQ